MKNLRPALLLLFVLLLAVSAFSQRKFGGKVIEVIDGKTLVIQMETGKVTAVLQYIEIPEPEQPLYQTVKDHLAKLVLDKYVDFQPQGIMPAKTLGQLYLNGVDIGQQMVRDGAAWHAPVEKTGQSQNESEVYAGYQTQAKVEKRGVWSIVNLKPAWEFRADKEEAQRREEQVSWHRPSAKMQTASSRTTRSAGSNGSNVGAFLHGFNAETKTGYIETLFLPVSGLEGTGIRLSSSVAYFYKEGETKDRKGAFFIIMVSASSEPNFLKSNDLAVTVDGKKVLTGKASRKQRKEGGSVVETLTYMVTRSDIEKIANGTEVALKLGNFYIIPTPGLQMLLYNLLEASK